MPRTVSVLIPFFFVAFTVCSVLGQQAPQATITPSKTQIRLGTCVRHNFTLHLTSTTVYTLTKVSVGVDSPVSLRVWLDSPLPQPVTGDGAVLTFVFAVPEGTAPGKDNVTVTLCLSVGGSAYIVPVVLSVELVDSLPSSGGGDPALPWVVFLLVVLLVVALVFGGGRRG